jgi:serine/threonine protein kinase
LFRLAQGSASSVYLCREAENGSVRSLFALKLFRARSEFTGALDRFSEAARRVEALAHPNVTRLLGTGTFEGQPLIVSEYVDGCSLAALLKRYTAARPIPYLLAILFDAMRGLQSAHEFASESGAPLGLVHGNLCASTPARTCSRSARSFTMR